MDSSNSASGITVFFQGEKNGFARRDHKSPGLCDH